MKTIFKRINSSIKIRNRHSADPKKQISATPDFRACPQNCFSAFPQIYGTTKTIFRADTPAGNLPFPTLGKGNSDKKPTVPTLGKDNSYKKPTIPTLGKDNSYKKPTIPTLGKDNSNGKPTVPTLGKDKTGTSADKTRMYQYENRKHLRSRQRGGERFHSKPKSLKIAFAASFPAPIAKITVAAPVTISPPA